MTRVPFGGLFGIVVAAVSLIAPRSVVAQEPTPVVSQHELRIGGRDLVYTAEAGRMAIRDVETGEPLGYMFYTAYRVKSTGKPRPILFLFGGGPGGYSANLNFEFAGPMRADGAKFIADGTGLVPNPDTLLTDADLVFPDAIGAGYSRMLNSSYAPGFYSTVGDTNAFAEFIRVWRIAHDAEDSPVYLGGLSWGAPRASTVAYALLSKGYPVKGVIMMSGDTSLNQIDEYMSPALYDGLRVVGMAGVAFYHGRLSADLGGDMQSVARSVEAWVRERYAPALEKVATLTLDGKRRIAGELSDRTGIPAERIDLNTLRINPTQFQNDLLRDQDKTLYGSDLRLTTPIPNNYGPAIVHYMKYSLGYRTDLTYNQLGDAQQAFSLTGKYPDDVNSRWNFATSPLTSQELDAIMAVAEKRGAPPVSVGKPLPATAEAIALNRGIRYLIASGRYDSGTNCASKTELMKHLPAPLTVAITFKCYDAGHSIFRSIGVLPVLSGDVRALIRESEDAR